MVTVNDINNKYFFRDGVLNDGYDNGNTDSWTPVPPSRNYTEDELTHDNFYQQQTKVLKGFFYF